MGGGRVANGVGDRIVIVPAIAIAVRDHSDKGLLTDEVMQLKPSRGPPSHCQVWGAINGRQYLVVFNYG